MLIRDNNKKKLVAPRTSYSFYAFDRPLSSEFIFVARKFVNRTSLENLGLTTHTWLVGGFNLPLVGNILLIMVNIWLLYGQWWLIIIWFVVELPTPKNDGVSSSVGMMTFPTEWKVIIQQCSKPPSLMIYHVFYHIVSNKRQWWQWE